MAGGLGKVECEKTVASGFATGPLGPSDGGGASAPKSSGTSPAEGDGGTSGTSGNSGGPSSQGPPLGWAEPYPLCDQKEAPAPYPFGALPPLLGAAVESHQSLSQQPIELVAATALGAASIVVQGLVDVERDSQNRGPSTLSLMTVAQSGERKTAAEKAFFSPLRDWERAVFEEKAPEIEAYERKRKAYEARTKGLTDAIAAASKKGRSADCESLEKELVDLADSAPMPPILPRLVYADTTEEAMLNGLGNRWPNAGLATDEAGIFFGGHSLQDERSLRTFASLNSCWDGKRYLEIALRLRRSMSMARG